MLRRSQRVSRYHQCPVFDRVHDRAVAVLARKGLVLRVEDSHMRCLTVLLVCSVEFVALKHIEEGAVAGVCSAGRAVRQYVLR